MSSALPSGPPVKEYRLYLSGFVQLMIFFGFGLFTAFAILMLAGVIPTPRGPVGRPFGIVWLGIAAFVWYRVLTMPHRIEVFADGRIRFVSLLRRIVVSPRDVESITPTSGQIGFFVLKHSAGQILFIGQFEGFHEFLSDLKAANPSVLLRGC